MIITLPSDFKKPTTNVYELISSKELASYVGILRSEYNSRFFHKRKSGDAGLLQSRLNSQEKNIVNESVNFNKKFSFSKISKKRDHNLPLINFNNLPIKVINKKAYLKTSRGEIELIIKNESLTDGYYKGIVTEAKGKYILMVDASYKGNYKSNVLKERKLKWETIKKISKDIVQKRKVFKAVGLYDPLKETTEETLRNKLNKEGNTVYVRNEIKSYDRNIKKLQGILFDTLKVIFSKSTSGTKNIDNSVSAFIDITGEKINEKQIGFLNEVLPLKVREKMLDEYVYQNRHINDILNMILSYDGSLLKELNASPRVSRVSIHKRK